MNPETFVEHNFPISLLSQTQVKFLNDGMRLTVSLNGDDAISLSTPVHAAYTVAETDAARGHGSGDGNSSFKSATLDCGVFVVDNV